MTAPANPSINISGQIIDLLKEAGFQGMTWNEVAAATGYGHETVTGNLSPMHRDGIICRLSQRRGRSRVYVTPDNVFGRTVESQGWSCGCCGGTMRLRCEECGWEKG